MNTVKKISKFKQTLDLKEGKGSVSFGVSDELMPDQATIDQLAEVAKNKEVFQHVAALTDVCQKPGRKNPSGTVVATKDYFMPQLLDTAPNCGMRLISTPFDANDLTEEKIDRLFKELINVIPTKTYLGTYLPYKVIMDISRRGSIALLEYLKEDTGEVDRILHGGNMFGEERVTDKDLYKAIPKLFFHIAQLRTGILGAAGNHFLDLMKITDVVDEDLASKFGLHKNQYVFLMHTGSGLFGQYASYFYTPKKKEHSSQKLISEFSRLTFLDNKTEWHKTLKEAIPKYSDSKEFFKIKANSELGKNYFNAHRAAANHGFANRTLLQYNLKNAIEKVLGEKNALKLVYDMTHVSATKEKHFGEDVIVHRSNATRAYGPEKMKGHKLFEETGEPIFMPSSMSTEAYFGVGTDENEQTFFSAAHGTGKSKDKTSKVPENREELMKKMEKRKVRLYNGASRGIENQDASHYKDPTLAIAGMEANKVVKPVVKMMPVAVLMA
ncbi:RtcB family protein [bacterium]|jgi:tRNA-splicing ligase RtcB (3'-phosphate/5'-hydroxy nucleic acid ligase)|nr:RtcB family protein [bacterium]MBT4251353.1 RtcB family protein [bacterium]MBT4598266.1 RtcB family protein [bacterium]MBT6754099.1 RtcB family protein [bacterium]MBT7037919.1 RtcB family protein [bacterium]